MSRTSSGRELPLAGRRILLTRPRDRAGKLVEALERLGAHVVVLPTIRTEAVDDGALERECRALSSYDWLVFTSATAVDPFTEALVRAGGKAEDLRRIATCAVGPATARALRQKGIAVDVVPREHVGEAVPRALAALGPLEGKRILLPRSEQAREVLPRLLRAAGANVTDVVAYRTVSDMSTADEIRRELRTGDLDLLVFTSGSAVHSFMDMVGREQVEVPIATIGPITSAAVRDYGLPVRLEAEPYTAEGLVSAIGELYG